MALTNKIYKLQGKVMHYAWGGYEFYNDGTAKLRDGKLRDAESALQIAVASQREEVQPPALYNLGQVRFKQGMEVLKDSANPAAPAFVRCWRHSRHRSVLGRDALGANAQATFA